VLQLDVDPTELGNNVPAVLAACGDLKESLRALLEIISSRSLSAPEREWTPQALAQRAASFWAEVAERAGCNDIPMSPGRVIDTLWQHTSAVSTPAYNWLILVFGEALGKVLGLICSSQAGSRPLGVV